MNKNIKIIIIGFGSIGQRHWRNLQALGFRNVWVYDADKTKTAVKDLKVLPKLSEKVLVQFDVAFICSPNNLHIKHALMAAQAGCDLFIEKPLSHNLKGVNRLLAICQRKKLVNMVACNMRFHPCLKFIKSHIAKGKLGKIYTLTYEFGYYLPWWRPGQDYRKNYAAKKSTGGGVILDSGIHEIDMLRWLNNFEKIESSKFIFGKISDLEIETDDSFFAVLRFSNKVLGLMRADYLQRKYTHRIKVVGEKGNLEWDRDENIVWLKQEKKDQKSFEAKNYDLNDMYIDEVEYFFDCVAKRKETFNNIKNAAISVRYLLNR